MKGLIIRLFLGYKKSYTVMKFLFSSFSFLFLGSSTFKQVALTFAIIGSNWNLETLVCLKLEYQEKV